MRFFGVLLITFVVITAVLTTSLAGIERMVIRFLEPEQGLIEEFIKKGYDIASYRPGEYLDLVVTAEQLELFRDMGFDPIVTQTEEQLRSNIQLRSRTIDGYRTYDDILDEMQNIAAEYPDIVRLYNLGDSWGKIYTEEGNNYYSNYQHDIWGLKLTTNPDSLNDKPAVYYMGAHHAREPLSAEVPMDFLNLLLDNYETDDEIAFLIDNTEIWFIPLVNPDGHKLVLNEIDVWWRKNIRDNNENGVFDTFNYFGYGTDGVDPNRNYSFEWSSSSSMMQPTYPGPYAGSEPEISAMEQLMEEHHFVAGITYHTYSELVLYPFGYADNIEAPDVDALSDLAIEMAQSIPKLNSAGHYDPIPSWQLYPAQGTTDDYAYGVHGIFSYTLELGVEFIPGPSDIQQISSDNMEAALILLRRIHRSTLTGHVTDNLTGEPVVAEVFIEGIDDTGEFRHPYKSNEDFGRYYRMLLPGEYNVVFYAYGYEASEPYTVIINDDEQTILDAVLQRVGTAEVSGVVTDFHQQTPVVNAVVTLLDTPVEPVFTDEDGSFFFEDVSYGTYEISIRAEDYGMHLEEIIVSEPENFFSFYLYSANLIDVFDNLDYWTVTGDWGLSALHSYSGDYSLADSPEGDYESNMSSYALFSQPINLTDATNASLSFMTRYELESGYDYCYLQINGSGGNWETIAVYNGNTDWVLKEYSLNEYLGEEISVRFHFTSDQSVEEEGIFIDDFRIYISSPELSASDDSLVITADRLYQNFPNPFNTETTISFAIVEEGQVKIDIYNVLGQRVRNLVDDHYLPGIYNKVWDGKNDNGRTVGSGVYFYRLKRDESTTVKKMILLK